MKTDSNKKHRCASVLVVLLIPLISSSVFADEESKIYSALPDPLKLSDALGIGNVRSHPSMLLSEANQISAQSELERAESNYQINASLDISSGLIDPSPQAFDQSSEDNEVSLNIRKQLYDFGYTSSAIESAKNTVIASEFKQTHTRRSRDMDIVKHYYAVVLSDLKYLWDNEAMSMRFVRMDKSRDRFALKQISDVELLEDEVDYQQALTKRRMTDFEQRTTRALLAESINRPGELSTNLDTQIRLKQDLVLSEPDEYIIIALKNNAQILEQQNVLSAAQHAVKSVKKRWHPTLEAEIKVSEYSRELSSHDNWRAHLNLHVPLSQSASNASEVMSKRSEFLRQKAILKRMESALRSKVYELWQKILTLDVENGQLKVEEKHVQRNLDKSRGEYELEQRTDFGVALVNTSRVRYQLYKNQVDQVMAWMELMILIGEEPVSIFNLDGKQ